MTRQIFWGCTNWNIALEDLESNVGPFSNRFQIHTSVDKSLRQITSACFQGIRPNRYRSGNFVRFEELDGLDGKMSNSTIRFDPFKLTSLTGNSKKSFSARYSL